MVYTFHISTLDYLIKQNPQFEKSKFYDILVAKIGNKNLILWQQLNPLNMKVISFSIFGISKMLYLPFLYTIYNTNTRIYNKYTYIIVNEQINLNTIYLENLENLYLPHQDHLDENILIHHRYSSIHHRYPFAHYMYSCIHYSYSSNHHRYSSSHYVYSCIHYIYLSIHHRYSFIHYMYSCCMHSLQVFILSSQVFI